MSVEVGTHAVGSNMGTERRVVISHKPKFSIQRLDQHKVAHKVRSRQEHSILATGSSQAYVGSSRKVESSQEAGQRIGKEIQKSKMLHRSGFFLVHQLLPEISFYVTM